MNDDGPKIFTQIYNDRLPMRERVAGLIELLRSDEPIPRGTRTLLAELFDPDATIRFRIELKERRGKGEHRDAARKIAAALRDSNIANALIERINGGQPRKAAIADVCEQFSLGKSTVQAIAKRYDKRLRAPSNEME
jgi:hypothetical protein